MSLVQPVRIDEGVDALIELKSREEHLSKSTVLKQFIYEGIEDYAIELCAVGRLSVSKCAELLNRSVWEILDMAKQKNIILSLDEDLTDKSYETTKKIAEKLKQEKKR